MNFSFGHLAVACPAVSNDRNWPTGDRQGSRAAKPNYARQSSPGTIRRMNSSNSGTVNAVSPWLGLQTMPLAINELRTGPRELTSRLRQSAIAPDRWGPGPSSAMARR